MFINAAGSKCKVVDLISKKLQNLINESKNRMRKCLGEVLV